MNVLMPLNHILKMVKLIKLYIMYILPHTKGNCKSVWRVLWLQEYSRTVKMLVNNAYLNLGEMRYCSISHFGKNSQN